MKCSSCKNISFDNCPTYQDLFESPHLDFYYEELEQDTSDDPNWKEGDDLMAVIHCYECGTTRKANGEVTPNGTILTKEEMEAEIGELKIISTTTWDFSKKEVRDKWRRETPQFYQK